MSDTLNAFSIDLEDWFQVFEENDVSAWDSFESRIENNSLKLIDIMDKHKVKATIFALGYIAEKYPGLIKLFYERGHEIGSHGYSHTQIFRLTPEKFDTELKRTNDAIGSIIGKQPIGFRAPIFSIVDKSFWAFDVLLDNGFKYDSSVYPVLNYRYGMVRSARFKHIITAESGRQIVEIPVTTGRLFGVNLPVAGGAYFRFWPYRVIKWGFNQVNKSGYPGVFYMHPWEVDPDQPDIEMPRRIHLTHYHRLESTLGNLERLFTDFKFSSMADVFGMEY